MTSIYIESGDEITTVIERLRGASGTSVALVAPKGATLLQSVVNLKLARRAAQEAGKEIAVVTTDSIGRNLCNQLGIAVAGTEDEAAKVLSGVASSATSDEAKVIAGVRIHHYYDEDGAAEDSGDASKKQEPIIIPKQMMKEEAPAPEMPIAVPAGIPEPPQQAEVVQPAPEAEPIKRTTISRGDLDGKKEAVETIAPAVAAASTKTKKVKQPPPPTTKLQKRVMQLSLYIGGVGVLAILAILFLFLPFTNVSVAVQASDWNKDVTFTGSSDATQTSADHLTVPAQIVTTSYNKTVTFNATGTQQVGDKASGKVTFNNSSTTSTLTVPSGTAITSAGQGFVTTAAVQVPGLTISGGKITPGTQDAPITANDPGPASNLTNSLGDSVTIGKDSMSTVINTSGGTDKTVTIVSADDITKAEADLTQQLSDGAKAQLADQLKDRTLTYKQDADIFTPGPLNPSVAVGTQAATAQVSGSATLQRTVVDTSTLQSALDDLLLAQQLKENSYKVTSTKITVTSISSDYKQLTIAVSVAGKEAPVVPVDSLAAKLSGKSLSAGEQVLMSSIPNATVSVSQRPGWWPVKRFPTVNRYIVVNVTYE